MKSLNMKKLGLIFISGSIIVLCLIGSCKKSSPWNFSTALTATFSGSSQQYVAPAGLVNNITNYVINGYIANATSNTIALGISDSLTGTYSLVGGGGVGNTLTIVNNGISYSSTSNAGASAGVVNVVIKGTSVTGSFNGTLYGAGANYQDSLVVTNGSINTTY